MTQNIRLAQNIRITPSRYSAAYAGYREAPLKREDPEYEKRFRMRIATTRGRKSVPTLPQIRFLNNG